MQDNSNSGAQRKAEVELLVKRYKTLLNDALTSTEGKPEWGLEHRNITNEAKRLGLTIEEINEDGRSNFIKSQQAIVDALSKETFVKGEPFVPPRPLSENGDEPERPGSTDCSNAGSVRSGICLFGE